MHYTPNVSEFTYGHAITREVGDLLSAIGCSVTPFLPSLLHEKVLGFDVSFDRPGVSLLLQFKVSDRLTRFHTTKRSPVRPAPLADVFYRFFVDVDSHQFANLQKQELEGAEVFYIAPEFATWQEFSNYFAESKVAEKSVLIKPSEIQRGSKGKGGRHRVVYDGANVHVCSKPVEIRSLRVSDALKKAVEQPVSGLEPIRYLLHSQALNIQRINPMAEELLDSLPGRPRSDADWAAALVGINAWQVGAQTVFATR
ncbi:hypothetical protein [Maricaulis sp. CAU 1757]